MYDEAKAVAALEKAHNAGDTAGAQAIADYIKAGRAAMNVAAPATKTNAPFGEPEVKAARERAPDTVLGEMTTGGKVLASAGGEMKDIAARGPTQILRKGAFGNRLADAIGLPSEETIQAEKGTEKPLAATTPGKVGRVLGGAAVAAPAMLIPGANTAIGSSIVGGVTGGLASTAPGESRLKNVGTGTAAGLGGHYIGKGLGAAASKAGSYLSNAAREAFDLLAPQRDAVSAAKGAGLTLPPKEVAQGGLTNRALTYAAGGSKKVEDAAAAANKEAINKVARQDLGLRPNEPITKENLQSLERDAIRTGYEPLRKLTKPVQGDITDEFVRKVGQLTDEDVKKQILVPYLAQPPKLPSGGVSAAKSAGKTVVDTLNAGKSGKTVADVRAAEKAAEEAAGKVVSEKAPVKEAVDTALGSKAAPVKWGPTIGVTNSRRAQYSITPKDLIDEIVRMRQKAVGAQNAYVFGRVETQDKANAYRQAATEMENLLMKYLGKYGRADLGATGRKFLEGRTRLAKIHDIQSSVDANGNIDARAIAKLGDHLTGGLASIARVARSFPEAVAPGVRAPEGARAVAGSAMMNPLYQSLFARAPSGSSTTGTMLQGLGSQPSQDIMTLLIRQGLLPASPQGNQ